MKLSIVVLLIITVGASWLFFRPKLSAFLARLGLALRVATVAYFVLLIIRLARSGVDEEQLRIGGISILFFGAMWAVAWLVTRSIARTR
ncbi:MAG: hypothetical protein M1370_07235 [Bacteroidetes bacterium]|nr:hypothetical protein [Bacteroidota bacterium]